MRIQFLALLCMLASPSLALAQQPDTKQSAATSPAPANSTPKSAQAGPQKPSRPQSSQSNRGPDASPQTGRTNSLNLNDAPPTNAVQDSTGTFNLNDLGGTSGLDDLDLDSNQSFDFDDSDDFQLSDSTADHFQNSVASNSDISGASPQMIGDFGGGSTIFSIGGQGDANALSAPIPFAGGSRRMKIAENNQVTPLNRIYGTFNYFHNSSQIVGAGEFVPGSGVTVVNSESLIQYSFGIEKTFFGDYFSIDLRMPFTSGIDQFAINPSTATGGETVLAVGTGQVGNLSTTLKAYLLQAGQTSISGGLQVSIPTGQGVEIDVEQEAFVGSGIFDLDTIDIENNAVHLMPFIGVYRPQGDSWWLQAFTQVDTPTIGNEVRTNGVLRGRINEQTLLYSDVSIGRWLYRRKNNSRGGAENGVTGIASIIELHYTTSLSDADGIFLGDFTTSSVAGNVGPGYENRFDVLNMTLGLQLEFNELWRLNVAGAIPLREGRFEGLEGRREDRFFDGEFSFQLNRFF